MKIKNYKKIIISISIVILASLSIFLLFNNYILSDNEAFALKSVQKLKDSLKDPSSLILYNDIIYVFYRDSKEETWDYSGGYIYILDYGAKNSYGAMIRSSAMFFNNKYVGTMEDAEKALNNSKNEILTNDEISLIKAYSGYLAYLTNQPSAYINEVINKSKIMRRLK